MRESSEIYYVKTYHMNAFFKRSSISKSLGAHMVDFKPFPEN